MNRTLWIACSAVLFASPAYALRVVNMDKVPHTVIYEYAGKGDQQVVKPNSSIYFVGVPDGTISLADAPPDHGTLHADGILGGFIGAERSSDIPAEPEDDFSIWPGGRLALQFHRKDYGGESH